jgi:DnaJ-class molecular chaperone
MTEMLFNTNDLHSTLKQMEAIAPDDFKSAGITHCGHCDGTGLKNRSINDACRNCNGVGYKDFKNLKEGTICPDCNATGYKLMYENNVIDCPTCEGSGYLDWIQAIQKGVEMSKIW